MFSFLGKMIGKFSTNLTVGNTSKYPTTSPTAELQKSATCKKKNGDIEGAIKDLKKSYKIMCEKPEWFSAEQACRLPLYLNEAKKNDEAWATFQDIIGKSDRYNVSVVFDKQRLFLQRSEVPLEAVKYGIFSHLADMRNGFYLNKEAQQCNREATRILFAMQAEDLAKLLKKAGRVDFLNSTKEVSDKHFSKIPDIDYKEIGLELNTIFYPEKSSQQLPCTLFAPHK